MSMHPISDQANQKPVEARYVQVVPGSWVKYPIHVQLDMETLYTGPRSTVLSVGVAAYQYGRGVFSTWGATMSMEEQINQYRRRISQDTLAWWMNQSPEARAAAFDNPSPVGAVLMELRNWFCGLPFDLQIADQEIDVKDIRLWSNGSDFDVAILRDLHDCFPLAPFWNFRKVRCYRTILDTFAPSKEDKEALYPTERAAHDAKQDAVNQALVHLRLMDKFEILRT